MEETIREERKRMVTRTVEGRPIAWNSTKMNRLPADQNRTKRIIAATLNSLELLHLLQYLGNLRGFHFPLLGTANFQRRFIFAAATHHRDYIHPQKDVLRMSDVSSTTERKEILEVGLLGG
ncbi:hypothetical protein Ancab_022731 [Ancistrocladus abbreviatus]